MNIAHHHDKIAQLLSPFMGQARWFTGSSSSPEVEFVADVELSREPLVIDHVIRSGKTLFSVPLVYTSVPEGHSPIGDFDADGDSVFVSDATDDADGQRAILASVLDDKGNPQGLDATHPRGTLEDLPAIEKASKLTSEQSNTSIIYRFCEPDSVGSSGIILKVFRVLSDGENPDVVLQQALDSDGSGSVAHQYGSARLTHDDQCWDMFVAQEFLAGSADAWQVITDGLENTDGRLDNREDIVALGTMTRDIHDSLARSFPTVPASEEDKRTFRDTWASRATQAIVDAPQLAQYQDKIDEVFDAALAGSWPKLQRIHGDYHLGQVLNSPVRGWVALDFEGEPLRPLSQRVQPDLAVRDVAGMLRSFEYAAGSALKAGGDAEALDTWLDAAKAAFMEGYGDLDSDEAELLFALTLDKALYEVSYEAASRPAWIDIPLSGVERLLTANETDAGQVTTD